MRMADNPIDIFFLVSYDLNDHTMNNKTVLDKIKSLGAVHIGGFSTSKIHAVNRDMDYAPDYDIAVLVSDDMICHKKGWDTILKMRMEMHFPDTDGCLFFWDGDPATAKHNNGKGLCTMNIMGKKYFDRFGYFYHPSYKSLWCDNEFTEVAQKYGKMVFSDQVIFKHDHYSNNGKQPDALMKRTQGFYNIDKANYESRKRLNFPK